MRILPIVFYTRNKQIEERFEIVSNVSSITHAHIRSIIACFYYTEFALKLIEGHDKFKIYSQLQKEIPQFLEKKEIPAKEINAYRRIFNELISERTVDEIDSSGYVVHSLEASL